MASKPAVAIIGPGNLGSTLAVRLREAGYRVAEVVGREGRSSRQKARRLVRATGARAVTRHNARLDAKVVWFCVPDREIANAARSLAKVTDWKGKIALHSSGALASDALDILRRQGGAVASLHPMMTFVRGSKPALARVPFAAEGDPAALRMARRIVGDLRGELFTISKANKAAYHAWGTFASPLLIALLAVCERVAGAAGVARAAARRRMLPIVVQTLAHYAAFGAARAFSGPIVRGDAAIVRKHLRILSKVPGARDVYLALVRSALRDLPVKNRAALRRALAGRN